MTNSPNTTGKSVMEIVKDLHELHNNRGGEWTPVRGYLKEGDGFSSIDSPKGRTPICSCDGCAIMDEATGRYVALLHNTLPTLALALIQVEEVLKKIANNEMPTDLDEEPHIMAADALAALHSPLP